jgi:hypothetical protein
VLQGETTGSPDPTSEPQVASGEPAAALLSVGTWIELTRDDGIKARLKVAWIGPDGTDYVLVDRHGRRGPDLTERELRTLLDHGLAKPLGSGREPIADRALRSVLNRLGR